MKLGQFDRLQQLVKETTDLVIKLKFENKSLKDKYAKLQEEVNNGSKSSSKKIKRLEEENFALKQKRDKVSSRLVHLRNKVSSLAKGVNS